MRVSLLRPVLAFTIAAGLWLGAAGAAAAQAGEESGWIGASPTLPAGHWAHEALRRLEALGAVHRTAPPQGSVPVAVVARALAEASERGERLPPATAALLQAWTDRFAAEYPGAGGVQRTPGARHEAWAGVGGLHAEGRAAPGLGEFEEDPERTGAMPLPDVTQLQLALGGHWTAANLVGFEAEGALRGGSAAFRRLQGHVAAGPIQLTVGRGPAAHYGLAAGGVVLSTTAPLDRVEIQTLGGHVLPSLLRHLGPVGFHTLLGVLNEQRHPGNPLFWAASATVRPLERVSISVHRAAIMGGALADAYGDEVTLLSVLQMIIGKHSDFEDQIVSAEFRFRAPTDAWLPLTLYLEWGAEDSAGAFRNVPGRVYGLFFPALPGVPQLSGGLERAEFHPSCCGNPKWYRHWQFPGGWATHDRTLAHPLGGEGEEWAGYLALAAPRHGADLRARFFQRERGPENLFAPGREGGSTGFSVTGSYAPGTRGALHLSGSRESGDGWAETVVSLGGTLHLRSGR